MKLSYMSRTVMFYYVTALFLSLVIGSFLLFLIISIVLACHFFLYRKKVVFDHEDQITTLGTVYAPISGKVVAIKNDAAVKIITIRTSFIDNFGIYLPITCEVKNLIMNKDSYLYRFSSDDDFKQDRGTVLELKDKKNRTISMNFIRYFSGKAADLVILPGDRGRRQSAIGFFPFGGVTKVILPIGFELEVTVGSRVISTETIVARFNEEENK